MQRFRFGPFAPAVLACVTGACLSPPVSDDAEVVTEVRAGLGGLARLEACAQDPRVVAGLVSQRLCAGADLFFRETFDGNGRTCGSCHPASNNFTIDVPFTSALFARDSLDPLFVFEAEPALATLESRDDFFQKTGIVENVDGFSDLTNRFAVRAVPHIFSLAITSAPDPSDGRIVPPADATGWSGDGAPGDGSLAAFASGAVTQHFPRDLTRVNGVAFREPTELESELMLEFQTSLGRTNELDFERIVLSDARAEDGRRAYLDPMRARCNVCHRNGGANFVDTGLNRNFDTFTRTVPDLLSFAGVTTDGGFGGKDLPAPNLNTLETELPGVTGFGDGTFNTPPVIEAVDTAPFFHNNGFGPDIEGCISFYSSLFLRSPAALELDRRFGAPLVITGSDIENVGRLLRVLSAAFNMDLATQRLRATAVLDGRFRDARGATVQRTLLELADSELRDALLTALRNEGRAGLAPLIPALHAPAQRHLAKARDHLAAALEAPAWAARVARVAQALAHIDTARKEFGTNITFRMGAGNILF